MDATIANDENFAKLSIFHTQKTVAQFLSQGSGLGKLANKRNFYPSRVPLRGVREVENVSVDRNCP